MPILWHMLAHVYSHQNFYTKKKWTKFSFALAKRLLYKILIFWKPLHVNILENILFKFKSQFSNNEFIDYYLKPHGLLLWP